MVECRCTPVRYIPTPWLSNLVVQSTIKPGEFDMWKCSYVLMSDIHPPQLNLVLQSSTTPGQFDMWQNAYVLWSGVPPPLVSSSSGTQPYYTTIQIYQNADIPRSILELILLYRTCFDCKRQAFKLSELFIRSEGNQTAMPLYGLLS